VVATAIGVILLFIGSRYKKNKRLGRIYSELFPNSEKTLASSGGTYANSG
jgi:hypothetical protein